MSDTDKVFTGSIPKLYDSYLVPLIFGSQKRGRESFVGLK